MIVSCKDCNARFKLEDELIKSEGTKVRCSKCKAIFTVYPSSENSGAIPDEAEPSATFDSGPSTGLADDESSSHSATQDSAEISFEEDGEEVPFAEEDGEGISFEEENAPSMKGEEDEEFGELELGLEMEDDSEPASETEMADEEPSLADDDEGSEDIELGLEMESLTEGEESFSLDLEEPAEAVEDEEELDFSDLENMLEDEDALAREAAGEPSDDLDFELELEPGSLDLDADSGSEMVPEEITLEAEEDLDTDEVEFELELESEPGTGGADNEAKGELDELDFAELESMLEEEGDSQPPVGEMEELDLDLDLSLESDSEPVLETELTETPSESEAEAPSGALDQDDLTDIENMFDEETAKARDAKEEPSELELELELEPESREGNVPQAEAEEFDLAEIEAVLDENAVNFDATGGESGDLDLELEDNYEGGPDQKDEVPEAQAAGDDELNLSDLEAMLDTAEETPALMSDADSESEELDLAELEQALDSDDQGDGGRTQSDELELEFDLVDDAGPGAGPGNTKADEMELEFESVDESVPAAALAKSAVDESDPAPGDRLDSGAQRSKADEFSPEDAFEDDEETAPVRKPRHMSALTIFVLILVLLAGGLAGGYYALNRMGIKLPFDYGATEADPAGKLKIITTDVEGRFVTSAQAGNLYVITGQARNDYEDPRRNIRITAKLFANGKQLVDVKTVACGSILGEDGLDQLDLKAIDERLAAGEGLEAAGRNVLPGQSAPFMVVFGNLPENLEEYTIEVAGSNYENSH